MVNDEKDGVTDMGLSNEGGSNVSTTETGKKVGSEGNSAGSSGCCARTYVRKKRKRNDSCSEDRSVSTNANTHIMHKSINDTPNGHLPSSSCNQVNLVGMDSHTSRNDSNDSSLKDCRKIFLEQMYQSLNVTEGGLRDCIQDALSFHPEGGCTSTKNESVHFAGEVHGAQMASKDHVGGISDKSMNDSSLSPNTEICKRALFNVLTSTKFAELCDLLFENFQGMEVSSLFDIKLIQSRIREGAYERSPLLFHCDIQQVWTKLQSVGTEIVALAKSLSEKSRAYSTDKTLLQKSNGHAKVEQTEGSSQQGALICRQCEEKAERRDCLVCDNCEEIYHILCIRPAIREIPSGRWYCTNCRAEGIRSPHENCLTAPVTDKEELGLEESADGLKEDGMENKIKIRCKICSNNLENEKFKVCGHSLCANKYYHERCLTAKQLDSFGSCWYCPSCLCRNCLVNQDDDKVVLCDGCDQAFHVYCMKPPRTSIPQGKWFCTECDEGLQRLQKVRKAYLDAEYKLRERIEMRKGAYRGCTDVPADINGDILDKSGGVELLLAASKTPKYEEKKAFQEHRHKRNSKHENRSPA